MIFVEPLEIFFVFSSTHLEKSSTGRSDESKQEPKFELKLGSGEKYDEIVYARDEREDWGEEKDDWGDETDDWRDEKKRVDPREWRRIRPHRYGPEQFRYDCTLEANTPAN